jgi:hypothetical protein
MQSVLNCMQIRMRNDELSIFAGQYIHGTLHVSQKLE